MLTPHLRAVLGQHNKIAAYMAGRESSLSGGYIINNGSAEGQVSKQIKLRTGKGLITEK